MQNTQSLYDFAKNCDTFYTPHIQRDYIRYDTSRPVELAKELEAWGLVNGYNIKASQVNNSVIVEVVVSPILAIIERLDELKGELNR